MHEGCVFRDSLRVNKCLFSLENLQTFPENFINVKKDKESVSKGKLR